jgi:hypothetical protein
LCGRISQAEEQADDHDGPEAIAKIHDFLLNKMPSEATSLARTHGVEKLCNPPESLNSKALRCTLLLGPKLKTKNSGSSMGVMPIATRSFVAEPGISLCLLGRDASPGTAEMEKMK